MRVSPILRGKVFYTAKNCSFSMKNNSNLFAAVHDIFEYSNKSADKISFRGAPYVLKQPYSHSISAQEGIEYFNSLKLGNYLDLNGRSQEYSDKLIRRENLSFLDKIKTPRAKQDFIDYYKELTGFPNLAEVSGNIKKQFIIACAKAEAINKQKFPKNAQYYDIISAGYDGVSSVARNMALPASDLDKAYIILRGCNSDKENETAVNNFKADLWKNTDQRILSYNHDLDSFPKVYTEKQIMSIYESVNGKAQELDLDKKDEIPPKGLFDKLFKEKTFKPSKRENYKALTKNYNSDYIEANTFFIELASKYKSEHTWEKGLNVKNPSREDIYNAAFVLEAMFKGEILIGKRLFCEKDTSAAGLINLSQIEGIKKLSPMKDKYLLRKRLNTDFESWDVDKKFNFVKECIKASCGDDTEFPEYFKSNTENKFNSLLKKLKVGLCD